MFEQIRTLSSDDRYSISVKITSFCQFKYISDVLCIQHMFKTDLTQLFGL